MACRSIDFVGEQAQTAPLLNHQKLPASPGKRVNTDNDIDAIAKRKRRESLLQFSSNNSQSGFDRGNMPEATSGYNQESFTHCALCDLTFLSELELEEHIYSLLHHRALDTEKGKDYIHECNLCFVRCKGLSEYVAHLRDDKHKINAERRKDDVDRNSRSTALHGLSKFKDTFIYPPSNHNCSNSLPPNNSSTKLKIDHLTRSPNLKKGQLYHPSDLPRGAMNTPKHRPMHHSFNDRRNPERFQRPFPSRHFSDTSRTPPRGSTYHQRYLSNPRDSWKSRGFSNYHRSKQQPRVYPDVRYHDQAWEHGDQTQNIFSSQPPSTWKPVIRSQTSQHPSMNRNNHNLKTKQDTSFTSETGSTPSSDTSNLQVQDLRDGASGSSYSTVSSLKSKSNKYQSKKKKGKNSKSNVKEQNKTKQKNKKKNKKKKNNKSNSQSPLNLPQSNRFDLKQTTASVSSSHKSLPKTGSATSSDSLLTKDLRNRFRMIMDEIKPPQSSRSASSSTLTSTPTSTGFEPATFSHQKPLENPTTCESCTSESSKRSIITPLPVKKSSLESPSTIRGKLIQLAKKKEDEISQLPTPSDTDKTSTPSNPTDSLHTQSSEISDASADVTKKKEVLKPNLSKARCRLINNKPPTSVSNPCDTEPDKQTRLANLMLKRGPRNKPHCTSSVKQPISNDNSGPRFGIGVRSRDSDLAVLDESDLKDIVETIEEAESSPGNQSLKSPVKTNTKPPPTSQQISTIKSAQPQTQEVSSQPPSFPSNHKTSSQLPPSFPSNHKTSSQFPPSFPSNHKTSFQPPPSKPSDFQPSSSITPTNSCNRSGKKLSTPGSSDNPREQKADEDLSLKLLHMSEREELLHSQTAEIKQKSETLHNELKHVNSLIEQLLDRRKDLEEASVKIVEEEDSVKQEMDEIRQKRLVLLRASTGSTPTLKPSTPSGEIVRPGSQTHSTPTPRHNKSFPDSQSSISTTSLNPGPPNLRHPSPTSKRLSNSSADVKFEAHPPSGRSFTDEPFPVPSNSVYYDPDGSCPDTKPFKSSVDNILSKYMKDAEREVTSSTVFDAERKSRDGVPPRVDRSPDHEVSSTTPHQASSIKNHYVNHKSLFHSPHNKKKLPSDTRLAKLTLEQPSSKDITSSWVTAHEGSYDCKSTNQNPVPITLSKEQSEIASLRAITLEHHTNSVLAVFVTKCGKILSCSKDKTLCVSDLNTGQLVQKHHLPGVPFKTCFADDDVLTRSLMMYVVFVDDTNERGMLSESSLHSVLVDLDDKGSSSNSSLRMKKLLDHPSCIMSIHHDKDLLYLGARNGNVTVYSTSSGKVKDTLDCHSPHAVCCLTTGTDGARRVLCCGSSDCLVSVRDAEDGLLLKTLLGHSKTVNCIQLRMNLVYSGASDRSVLVHNIHTGHVMYRFLGMHGGSIKELYLHDDVIITLCMDKSIRTLRTEPSRISGPVKPLSHLPLCMFISINELEGSWGCHISLPFACVGCQNGKLQVLPLTQLACQLPLQKEQSMNDSMKLERNLLPLDLINLQCLWNNCGADGFTSASSLLTHISLFHATDSYKESLNSCCLWGDCTHYFSSDLDTALDVHIHMDKHVSEQVQSCRH